MKIKLIVITLALATMIPGCQKEGSDKNELISVKWFLEEIQYTDTQTKDPVPANLRNMNIVFSDSNWLRAISSCNLIEGPFAISDTDSLEIHAGTTKIYCTDPITRFWDSTYYHNLNMAKNYYLKDRKLYIVTTNNTTLIFK